MWPLSSLSTAVALEWTVDLEMAVAFRIGLELRMGGPLSTIELTEDSETTVSGSQCEASSVTIVVDVDIERTGGEKGPCCCSCDELDLPLSVPFS